MAYHLWYLTAFVYNKEFLSCQNNFVSKNSFSVTFLTMGWFFYHLAKLCQPFFWVTDWFPCSLWVKPRPSEVHSDSSEKCWNRNFTCWHQTTRVKVTKYWRPKISTCPPPSPKPYCHNSSTSIIVKSVDLWTRLPNILPITQMYKNLPNPEAHPELESSSTVLKYTSVTKLVKQIQHHYKSLWLLHLNSPVLLFLSISLCPSSS